MATMLMPPTSPPASERVLRIPSIAANLLPLEIIESRRGRRVRRGVLIALVLVVVVLGAWVAGAKYQTTMARDSLADAQQDAGRLAAQQSEFADVIRVQSDSKVLSGQLSTLMANDLRWSKLISALRGAAPNGVQLTGVTAALATQTGAAGTGQLPNTTGAKLIGSLTVNGTAQSKPAVAAYLDAIGKLSALGNPLLTSVTKQDTGFQFTVKMDITGAALGGRFTKTGGS
jgi:Tfp pilus assembly protein PilN